LGSHEHWVSTEEKRFRELLARTRGGRKGGRGNTSSSLQAKPEGEPWRRRGKASPKFLILSGERCWGEKNDIQQRKKGRKHKRIGGLRGTLTNHQRQAQGEDSLGVERRERTDRDNRMYNREKETSVGQRYRTRGVEKNDTAP